MAFSLRPSALGRWIPWLLSSGIFFLAGQPSCAQSITVVDSTSSGRGFTASNSSGISFSANGTFIYEGPLNERRELPLRRALSLDYNGQRITVSSDDILIQTRMLEAQGLGISFSPQIVEGAIPVSDQPQLIQLGYSQTVPAITRVSGSNSTTRFELVDGQSLSIFPSFSPSVFP